jgi:uncharacterized protein (DUF849 family)
MIAQASPEARGPVAIAVAPNGGRRTRRDHPALPSAPGELARTAAACRDAGASMMHLHVRDAEGRHLLDGAAYREALDAIEAEVGDTVFLQISSESLGVYSPAEQIAVVKAAKPPGVSLALREFAGDAAGERAFADFLAWLKRERIAPQFILYTPDEAGQLRELSRRGVIPWNDPPVLFVLGRYAANQTSTPADLLPFLAPERPSFRHWMVCAFGPREADCVLAGARRGGHGRVGFENNLHLPDGSVAGDNAALVAAAASLVRSAGGQLATAAQLREQWSLS